MNETIIKTIDTEIAVRDPFSDTMVAARDVSALIKSCNNRLAERAAQFDALGDLETAPLEAVKELKRAIADDDKTIRDYERDLKDALLDASGFTPFVVQARGAGARIDALSVRGKFAAMLKELEARIDAEKIVAPPTSWVLDVYANEEQLTALAKAAKKLGIPTFRWAKPQTDKAKSVIIKFFKENI